MDDETKPPPRRNELKTRQNSTGRKKPWTFPKNTLEDAIKVARAIEEKNAGNPMRAADLTKAVRFRQPNDWRFLDLLRSANQYGLVSGTPSTSISLTKQGQDVVAPSSPGQRADALLTAFRNVDDFAAVENFYGGKPLPEDEFFLNTLTREFNIPRDRLGTFATVFQKKPKISEIIYALPYASRTNGHLWRCTFRSYTTRTDTDTDCDQRGTRSRIFRHMLCNDAVWRMV